MTELENKGGFTLPGEAGYEKLTLELAKKWGADVIRDSDGTELSPEITEAGYGIYSTICIIRGQIPGLWKIWINCSRLFLSQNRKLQLSIVWN